MTKLIAAAGLIVLSPIILPLMLLIWLQDFHNPLYLAWRTGKGSQPFRMIKLRSMIVNADRTGVDSTSSDDTRITKLGGFVRRFKLDELLQLVNVVKGEMSLVGPRPNIQRETEKYEHDEKLLLTVRPGITSIASIVYSDEGDILAGSRDPDGDYERLIKPGKNQLDIFYVRHASTWVDLQLIVFTVLAVFNRPLALRWTANLLRRYGAGQDLIRIATRREKLEPNR